MEYSRPEKGAALVVVLAIVVISTAIFAVVLHFLQKGTETAILQQKYETAKDASLGALDVFAKEVIPVAMSSSLAGAVGGFATVSTAKVEAGSASPCFDDKLQKATASWIAACNPVGTDVKSAPDIVFTLQSTNSQPFSVYGRIVDTVAGNTDMSGLDLDGNGVIESGGALPLAHVPYLYSIEVQGERKDNASERASFDALYAY